MTAGWGNPSPNAGILLTGTYGSSAYRLLGVPRWPTNLYFNVETPDDWVAADHCHFPVGDWNYRATYDGILARESDMLVLYMLSGDMDPLSFHQMNIRAYDGTHSIFSDLFDVALQKYSSLVNVPLISLPLDGLAARMADRMQFDSVRPSTSASVINSGSSSALKVNFSAAGTIPITGLSAAGAEMYAGQPITRASASSPSVLTFNLGASVSASSTVTVNPVQDTYIDWSNKTSTSGGTATMLYSDMVGTTTAFLRFDLSSVPKTATVDSAVLRVHTSSVSWAGSVATQRVSLVADNLWQEQWMSYNNTTPISNIVLGTFVGTSPSTWYSVPLTGSVVQSHVGGLISMAIQGLQPDALVFDSRESGPATAAQLVVTTH
jgi:hypothetical protein